MHLYFSCFYFGWAYRIHQLHLCKDFLEFQLLVAQSAEAVEYTDCTSAEE